MRKDKAPFIISLIALTGFTVMLYKIILFQDTTSLRAVTINKQVQGNEVKLYVEFDKTTLFMKIKHRFQSRESSKYVTVNGSTLKPEREKVKRNTDKSRTVTWSGSLFLQLRLRSWRLNYLTTGAVSRMTSLFVLRIRPSRGRIPQP